MTTPTERSNISVLTQGTDEPPEADPSSNEGLRQSASSNLPEPFDAPGIPTLTSLTDDRQLGAYQSIYPLSVWAQMAGELLYLLLIMMVSLCALAMMARYAVFQEKSGPIYWVFGSYPQSKPLICWATIALSGACGGGTSSLKWLYHTFAKSVGTEIVSCGAWWCQSCQRF